MTGPVGMINGIEELDSGWLTGAMHEAGTLPADEAVTVVASEPLGVPAFAGSLHRLTLSGSGLPGTAIVKLPTTGALRPVLDVLQAYNRELVFYRDIAPVAPIRCPRVLAAVQAADSTDFVLVIEDLEPLRTVDPVAGLSRAQAERTVDAIARFHAWSWNSPIPADAAATFPPPGGPLLDSFRSAYSAAWPMVVDLVGDEIDPGALDLGARLSEVVPGIVEELTAPAALIHGDLSGANIFFGPDDEEPIFVDFQTVTMECGAREVSHLLGLSVPTEIRRACEEDLLRRYRSGLRTHGVLDYPWEQAWRQYRLGLAYTLMPPVMVAARWNEISDGERATLRTYLRRVTTAIVDNDVGSLL
jgi:hypothetical protein